MQIVVGNYVIVQSLTLTVYSGKVLRVDPFTVDILTFPDTVVTLETIGLRVIETDLHAVALKESAINDRFLVIVSESGVSRRHEFNSLTTTDSEAIAAMLNEFNPGNRYTVQFCEMYSVGTDLRLITGPSGMEYWYITGQDGKIYRSVKWKTDPFDEDFWHSFDIVPSFGY